MAPNKRILAVLTVLMATACGLCAETINTKSGFSSLAAGDVAAASESFFRAIQFDRLSREDSAVSYLALGMIASLRDNGDDAEMFIKTALKVVPDYKIETGVMRKYSNQKFKAIFDKVKVEYTGSLFVNSNVTGVDVYIDNQRRGQTPLGIEGISIGYHQVRVGNQTEKIMVYSGQISETTFNISGPEWEPKNNNFSLMLTSHEIINGSYTIRKLMGMNVELGLGLYTKKAQASLSVKDNIFMSLVDQMSLVYGFHVENDMLVFEDISKTENIFPGMVRWGGVFGVEYFYKDKPLSVFMTMTTMFCNLHNKFNISYYGAKTTIGLNYYMK